jgi:integrase
MRGDSDVRVHLKGIHKVNKKLATGEIKTYYYAWRGGPRINAKPGAPDFMRLYTEAHASVRKPRAGTLMTLIAEFKGSADYARLAPSTVRAYASYINLIETEFGDLPITALTDPRVRGEFKAWRDHFAATPRKADYAWTTLARILSVAKDRGLIAVNPCEGGGRLYAADRTDKFWSEAEVAKVLAVARPDLQLAIILALWTGQRQGDLLRLPWSAYDGAKVRLQQGKTGAAGRDSSGRAAAGTARRYRPPVPADSDQYIRSSVDGRRVSNVVAQDVRQGWDCRPDVS